jgi:peroxiredoxin
VAEAAYYERELPDNPTPAERIERYKAYPWWSFLPKFRALAEAEPNDATALAACKWIIERQNVFIQWQPMYDADQSAWRILQGQRLTEEEILQLSLRAVLRWSPASEAFLRDLAWRTDLPGNAQAYATMALAEYLAQRFDEIESGDSKAWWLEPKDEFFDFLSTQLADGWLEYRAVADRDACRREGIVLLRHVLDRYADVPLPASAPLFRGIESLGEKAEKSLHALEHLVIGAEAPDAVGHDLDGKPLRLSDYRGKVVLLSFWFPTCGPCIEAIPEEQDVVERFRNEAFALIGVCRERDQAVAKQAATEHGMTWPSWFDGNPGAITDNYNIQGWPRFYLLDAEGRIVSKDVRWGDGRLAKAVEAVLRPPASESAVD